METSIRSCVRAGALLGALPLLYTMEMWWYARVVSEPALLVMGMLASGVVVLSISSEGSGAAG